MTEHSPITPPPELVQEWVNLVRSTTGYDKVGFSWLVEVAAQWGADQELEACCDVLKDWGSCLSPDLRSARRPKPPSLKEEALEALKEIEQVGSALVRSRSDTIRRAIESIPDPS